MSTEAPRRSTRAASAKPASKAVPAVKAAPRSKAAATKKRTASPERDEVPAPKRSKSEEQNVDPAAADEPKKSRAAAAVRKPRAKVETQLKPYLNPLPTPPEHTRPGLQLFAWGAGNFGQFGMGPDVLGELDKPRRHPWAEQQMQDGAFGSEGAGLEALAAGGMHSLFIDESGTVCSSDTFVIMLLILRSDMVLRTQ